MLVHLVNQTTKSKSGIVGHILKLYNQLLLELICRTIYLFIFKLKQKTQNTKIMPL